MLRTVFAACIAFTLFFIGHVTYFYLFDPFEKVNSLLMTATIGCGLFFLLLRLLPSEVWFQHKCHISQEKTQKYVLPLIGLLFYGFLFLGYLEFYFTADRSITFRMLMITNKQTDHAITKDMMFERYDVPGILDKRFDDLVYGNYLSYDGQRYHVTRKGNFVLNIYQKAIEYLHLGASERQQRAWAITDKCISPEGSQSNHA